MRRMKALLVRWLFALAVAAPFAAQAQDLQNGKDVYGPCASCHGANGEGGKGGEYPRLAGQPVSFIVESLKAFQKRKRMNIPMFPYTEPRELSDRDMEDVAAFLVLIDLPTRPPEFKETDSALDRLLAMERVLVVPRVEGDVAKGEALWEKKCAKCHGDGALGKESRSAPRLVGQYPDYLQRRFDELQKQSRGPKGDDLMNGALKELSRDDVTNVLAWLTSIQEASGGTAPAPGDEVAPADAPP